MDNWWLVANLNIRLYAKVQGNQLGNGSCRAMVRICVL